MVSEYDVFYIIATKGELRINDIVDALNKPKNTYWRISKLVKVLEKKLFIQKKHVLKIIHTEKTSKLFNLISFCINNNMNYNLLFKENMLSFIEQAAKTEFFTIKEVKFHPQTFNNHIELLSKYGFLLIISRKPLKCKLLKHHFLFDLLKFFGKKSVFYKTHLHSFINSIKKEIKKYKKLSKLHYNLLENLTNKDELKFIYSSLNLEGNPLTLPETQKLILEDVLPEKQKLAHIQEVTNYKNTVNLMILNAKRKIKLSLPLILEYHKIAMSQIPGAGKIRKQNVIIKLNPKFKTTDQYLIRSKLDMLMKKYDQFESKKRTLEELTSFAAFFHNEFQRIHPFIDGNSRISRLLMLHIIRMHNIPLLDLPIGYFDLYLDLTKRSTKRNDKALKYLVEELILTNLKKINKQLKNS
ncbi:hypothetical protein COV11_04220 [Candidatus Woesearchaeota archaeon CG10_big_fil_rev_8_21_14_0_10_30_7]|nr:MAG: hypothetical protein COV11_04220 [Candidatus Woesearchaeota archaeon CG10_big_fil_rev_8_21_14_0_10_30_7]